MFVGVAFFMPSRIGFSIWFFVVGYALYQTFVPSYFPPHHWQTVTAHRSGAAVASTLAVVWLGRAQWARVFGLLARPASRTWTSAGSSRTS